MEPRGYFIVSLFVVLVTLLAGFHVLLMGAALLPTRPALGRALFLLAF